MSDGTFWVKAFGIGALALGAVGIAALVVGGDGSEDGGTIPPDEIEGEDDDDGDDDLPVETVPGIFQK